MTEDKKRAPPKPMPEPVDATPEELAKAMLRLPPKHEWQYKKEQKEKKE